MDVPFLHAISNSPYIMPILAAFLSNSPSTYFLMAQTKSESQIPVVTIGVIHCALQLAKRKLLYKTNLLA